MICLRTRIITGCFLAFMAIGIVQPHETLAKMPKMEMTTDISASMSISDRKHLPTRRIIGFKRYLGRVSS
jgi:hypothetical protein